ncbi:MAG: polysaccharide export protein EpsE [Burkholderiaceae bacterium]|nr:polysaccharide export protein EpsE [Burkholderiaceae bacterium]
MKLHRAHRAEPAPLVALARAAAGALLLAAAAAAFPAAAQTAAAPPSAPPAAAAAAAAQQEYRLGAGDVIRISIFQNPDLTLETRVTEAGIISFPLLGTIRIGGLSVTQAEKLIADGLRSGNFVRSPQVTIVVLQVRGNQASVLGQVNRPGRFPLETADMRLTDLLALAGGATGMGAEVVVVTGTRNGQPFRAEVDLPTVFAPGGREKDILVQNGDVVWVDRQPMVYIYGEVQRPGPMRLERGMTLMQALATGGGLTLRGTEKGIRVHRKAADGSVRVITPGMDDRVQDGDVVYVRESLF